MNKQTNKKEANKVSNNTEFRDDFDYGIHLEPKKNKWLWPSVFVLFGILCFVGGYLFSHMSVLSDHPDNYQNLDSVVVEKAKKTDTIVAVKKVAADTVVTSPQKEVDQKTSEEKPKDAEQQQKVSEQKPKVAEHSPKADTVDYRKYEAMDARVRTGAYRIVGTAETVKVGKGETLKRISKRYMGSDMTCYIEVYNGITDPNKVLTEGMIIKVPKLELKKKKKQTSK
jgi:hypothetical protein